MYKVIAVIFHDCYRCPDARRAASYKLGQYTGLLTLGSSSFGGSSNSSDQASMKLGPAFVYKDDPLMRIDAPTVTGEYKHSCLQLCHHAGVHCSCYSAYYRCAAWQRCSVTVVSHVTNSTVSTFTVGCV
jgi:hypothetical protein